LAEGRGCCCCCDAAAAAAAAAAAPTTTHATVAVLRQAVATPLAETITHPSLPRCQPWSRGEAAAAATAAATQRRCMPLPPMLSRAPPSLAAGLAEMRGCYGCCAATDHLIPPRSPPHCRSARERESWCMSPLPLLRHCCCCCCCCHPQLAPMELATARLFLCDNKNALLSPTPCRLCRLLRKRQGRQQQWPRLHADHGLMLAPVVLPTHAP